MDMGPEGILAVFPHRHECYGSEPGRGPSVATLRQAVDTCRVDELLVADLLLQVALKFLQVNLSQCRTSHYKHSEHAVDALQRKAF